LATDKEFINPHIKIKKLIFRKYFRNKKMENKKTEIEKLKAENERLKKELKKKKKYGLVWEEKPEKVVEMCKEKLPVLKEVKNKEIITDKDKPVNLLIEGDNYHALSVLNYTHAKRVDVIYIDPPYNTGKKKEWKFNDQYVDKKDLYRHSKWLSFIEKRLKLAKNLLKDTGIIFISIDDNEMAQLKLLLDEIFRNGFLANIIWRKLHTVKNDAINFSVNTEYILAFSRFPVETNKKTVIGNLPFDKSGQYKYFDDWGKYKLDPLHAKSGSKTSIYKYKFTNGMIWDPPYGTFPRYSKNTLIKFEREGKIVFPGDKLKLISGKQIAYAGKNIMAKRYLQEVYIGKKVSTYWDGKEVGFNKDTLIEFLDLFGLEGNEVRNKLNPKPLSLIERLLSFSTEKNSVILDFFAGSGTTGHAVLKLNKKDNGNRKFILCTNNENNICTDVCYPRIKKVIERYKNLKDEDMEGLGGNLKYFKTDFVDYDEPTDRNKIKLTKQATEMLCVKEETFEKVIDNERFKIFKNSNHYTGIIWDQTAIPAFKKAIKNIKGRISVYIFSLGDETFDEEFKDIKQKVKLSSIPEAILRVYRRIFK
jgi:adenine-specific DNA-methyltransferase